MNIVIPYTASRWQDRELRYCLRSIEMYLRNVNNIYLVGDCPHWVRNVIHLPYEDVTLSVHKERNVYRKILHYCDLVAGGERFIYMNDDHYLLKTYSSYDLPNYYSTWPEGRTDMYGQTIIQTLAQYRDDKPHFFDVHFPMKMEKTSFRWALSKMDWDIKAGYCMKTLYASAVLGNIGVEATDLKIYFDKDIPLIEGREWFSIGETACTMAMETKLRQLYPNKSRYEK